METKRTWARMVYPLGMWVILAGMCWGKYSGGSGTADDPYQIWTAEEMNTIGLNTADWDKSFLLMADINMSAYTGTQYNIIGNATTKFTGTFDGGEHVIRNLTYTTTTAVSYVGLFGYSSGTIQNLGVENISISSGGSRVGGLVGINFFGTISNCHATGSVSGSGPHVGGLAGSNFHGTTSTCYAAGSVSCSGFAAGGLVGYNEAGPITACYATGSVISSYSCVGGLLGYNNSGNITCCYATGAVSSTNSCIGGLVGSNLYGIISTCYATGLVSGTNDVGGLAGENNSTITACFWDTQTSGQTTSAGGMGKTTAQMKTLTTFTSAGWDFTSVWGMALGQYPELFLRQAGDLNSDGGVDMSDLMILSQHWLEGV